MREETKQPQHQYISRGVKDNAASSVTDQSTMRGMDVEGDTQMAKYSRRAAVYPFSKPLLFIQSFSSFQVKGFNKHMHSFQCKARVKKHEALG